MRRALLAWLLSLMACQVAKVDDAVLYRCAPDGSCAGAASFCWTDGFCRANAEPPVDAGSPDACVPMRPCQGKCGSLPDGCGAMANCGGCNSVLGESCGGGGVPNVCGLTEICSDDGFCWKNPLPQGNALTSVWALSANQAWAVGRASTALAWDGARWSHVSVAAEADLAMVTGNAQDVFACGGPNLYRLQGGQFVPELTVLSESFISIHAAGDVVWAGTRLGALYQRTGTTPWARLSALSLGTEVTGLFTVDSNTAFAATATGLHRLRPAGSVREQTGAFTAIGGPAASTLHAIGMDDAGATSLWGRRADAGWQVEPLLLSDTLADGGQGPLDAGTVTPFPLTCIGQSAVDELWAAGDKGQQFRFDGTTWLEVRRFDPRARSIASVAGAQSKLFAVGELGTMWANTAGVLRQTSRGHNQGLRTVSVGPNTIWVSGNNNTALRNDPPNPDWTTVTIDAGQIAAIEQVAGVAVFAGSRQQIGIVGGTGPGVFQLGPEALDFTAMAGPPPLVVVGQRGLAYSQNAQGTFVRLDNPDAGDFRGVRKVAFGIFVITAHSLFGLGTDGGWGAIVTDPDEVLQDLEFISLDGGFEFFLPTQSAAVLSVTGAGATQLDSGVPGGHQAALMRGSELFLVGPNGAITVKPLGGPFSSLRSGTHFNLRALATDADGGLWVVGEQGTTLFRP